MFLKYEINNNNIHVHKHKNLLNTNYSKTVFYLYTLAYKVDGTSISDGTKSEITNVNSTKYK